MANASVFSDNSARLEAGQSPAHNVQPTGMQTVGLKEVSPRPFGNRVGAASWTAQVLIQTSTAPLATRDPKDSEVRNRGAQGARHTPRAARRSLIAEPGNN